MSEFGLADAITRRYHSEEKGYESAHQREEIMPASMDYSFDGLSVEDKFALVERLLDEIANADEELAVPSWQAEELARRKTAHLANPSAGSSWDEVKERIIQRHG